MKLKKQAEFIKWLGLPEGRQFVDTLTAKVKFVSDELELTKCQDVHCAIAQEEAKGIRMNLERINERFELGLNI